MAIQPTNEEYIIRLLADYTSDTLAELDANLATYVGNYVRVIENDIIYYIEDCSGTFVRREAVDQENYITSPANLATETTLQLVYNELVNGHGSAPENPTYVTLTGSGVIAPVEILSGVDGTVSIPVGARLSDVSAQSLYEISGTVTIGSLNPVLIPAGCNWDDNFVHSYEGPFDIVFTNTSYYYVTYYTGIVPAEVIIL